MSDREKEKAVIHEMKFVINNGRAHQVITLLRSRCRPDPEFSSGTVSSIYYDTRNWSFMGEKINSDYLKTKVRIRWYSDLSYTYHFDTSFAEAKFKIGGRREKVRIKTPYSGEWLSTVQLEDPRLLGIPHMLRTVGVTFNQDLFPVFQISYKRLRFIEPFTNSRICIDYDITAPRVNWYMLPKSNPFKLYTAVFEVKSELSELPETLYPLTDMGFRKSSFSKYSACYQQIMRIQF
jgi:hypothetical protein